MLSMGGQWGMTPGGMNSPNQINVIFKLFRMRVQMDVTFNPNNHRDFLEAILVLIQVKMLLICSVWSESQTFLAR